MKKIWMILYNIVPMRLPKSQHSKISKWIRVFFAKRILLSCGKNINIEHGAFFGPSVSIGDNSGIGIDCELYGPVEVGKNVLMGPEVIIYTKNHLFDSKDQPIINQGYTEDKKVIIGEDTWIGRRVIILPGVELGKGCVVGAGAVVTKSFEDYSVIGGNPAKLIKKRMK